VRFSAQIKTDKVKDWTGLMMRVKGARDVLAFDNMEDRPIKGTADWKPFSIVLYVPPERKIVRVGFLLAGTGTYWASNLKLETGSQDVPVTQKSGDQNRIPDTPRLRPELEFKAL